MKLAFLDLSPNERRLYLEQAAQHRNLSPVLLEKDFWVCWVLSVLFSSEFASSLVFKGGTSLAKVFAAIDRFSEDVDLSLSPQFLDLRSPAGSRNQTNKWMKDAEHACGIAVKDWIAPRLNSAAENALGVSTQPRFEFVHDYITNSPVLLFHYPSALPSGYEYLRRSVKLEFGSLTDQQPTGRHTVQPLLADIFPALLSDWRCEVVALEIDRTFWEKATILHAEYFRPIERPTPDRFSRHYADMAALARLPASAAAVDNFALRKRVVAWKGQFFGSAWARYDLARPGSFRLVPPATRLPLLRRDYDAMREMYFSQPVGFDDVLALLSDLERRINSSRG